MKRKERSCVYVDGSYNGKKGIYGYGGVLYDSTGKKHEFFGSGTHPRLVKLRNVAGEMNAALYAVEYALKLGMSALKIYYDYQGIESWVTGIWRATKKDTKDYANRMQAYMKDIDLSFEHVKAHSGNYGNEMADKLAKRGADIE